MARQVLQLDEKARRKELHQRNIFTLLWLIIFAAAAYRLAFGALDLVNTSGGMRLIIFLAAFAFFLGGFVAFDIILARLYPKSEQSGETTTRYGRQI